MFSAWKKILTAKKIPLDEHTTHMLKLKTKGEWMNNDIEWIYLGTINWPGCKQ